MTRLRRLSLAVLAAALASAAPAWPHGASRGLHVHLDPDHAAPEAEVEIAADCAEPMALLRVSFVGQEPFQVKPDAPAKRILVRLPVPEKAAGGTINVQAEARGESGKTYRASAILRLDAPSPSPSPSPSAKGA